MYMFWGLALGQVQRNNIMGTRTHTSLLLANAVHTYLDILRMQQVGGADATQVIADLRGDLATYLGRTAATGDDHAAHAIKAMIVACS